MAEASDTASARSVQRQKPLLPVPYTAAPSGVVSPGRRNLLGALAAAPMAAVAPASADGAEDPHLGWLAEFYAERARVDAMEDRPDDAYKGCFEIEDRILAAEPTTLGGVAAQLMVIAESTHSGFSYSEVTTRPVLKRAARLLPVATWYDCTSEEA